MTDSNQALAHAILDQFGAPPTGTISVGQPGRISYLEVLAQFVEQHQLRPGPDTTFRLVDPGPTYRVVGELPTGEVDAPWVGVRELFLHHPDQYSDPGGAEAFVIVSLSEIIEGIIDDC